MGTRIAYCGLILSSGSSPRISLAAAVLSSCSLLVAIGALRYSRRADRRAEREAMKNQQAEPIADTVVGTRGDDLKCEIRNIGRAPARNLEAWLVDAANAVTHKTTVIEVLPPGESKTLLLRPVVVEQTIDLDEERAPSHDLPTSDPLQLRIRWSDEQGEQTTDSAASVVTAI
jgi:hypothetical protein